MDRFDEMAAGLVTVGDVIVDGMMRGAASVYVCGRGILYGNIDSATLEAERIRAEIVQALRTVATETREACAGVLDALATDADESRRCAIDDGAFGSLGQLEIRAECYRRGARDIRATGGGWVMDKPTITVTAEQLDKMRHATGGKRNGHRNHFAAGEDDVATWRDLVAKGLASERGSPSWTGGLVYFGVTPAGLDLVYGRGK